jgi:putative MATE family efflux protein
VPAPSATLTEGDVRRQLVALTAPMIWGLLATMSFNAIDTYFVGQLGPQELAAISFTFPVAMLVVSLAIGIGAGSSSVIARAIGESDATRVRRLTTDSLVLTALLVGALSIAGLSWTDAIFRLLGAPEALLPLIGRYMRIWFAGMVLLIVPMVGFAAVRATGDTRLPSLVLIATAALNIALDPLLIFGRLGLPRLGIEGAAIAGLIARAGSFFAMVALLRFRHAMLAFRLPSLRELVDSWRAILHVGLPATGTNMVIPASGAVVTAMIARFGAPAVAGYGVATRIEAVALVVFYSLSGIMNPFVGQNAGARRRDRVLEALGAMRRFCLGFGAALAVAFGAAAPRLAAVFSADPVVAGVATAYLRVVPWSYGAAGIVMCANASLNGLGRPLPAVVLSVMRVIVVYLPAAWLLSRLLGVNGIFCAAAAANAIVAIAADRWTRALAAAA